MVVFQSEKISDALTRIYGIVGEQMYLVEGRDRAVLIDSGSGVGDLKGFVSSLTELPVTVLITHAHIDHAMGAGQFSEIHMSALDKEVYRKHCNREMQSNYLSSSPRFADVSDEDYWPILPDYCFRDLHDGDKFDLGGLKIEAILCAGHSPGSTMFLIHEQQTLIASDACSFFTMLQDKSCLGLSTFERSVVTADERTRGKYQTIHMSHGRMKTPVSLFDEVLEVCREIKAGQDDKIPFELWGTNGLVAKAFGSNYLRLDGKFGNVVYDPNRIWE